MDFFGDEIRNLVIANNVWDRCGNGGIEMKTQTASVVTGPDFYGDVLIANNVCNFLSSTVTGSNGGIGVALNHSSDHKMTRFKIVGNSFLCDQPGNAAWGVHVGNQDNVEITGNSMQGIAVGVDINAASSGFGTLELATNVSIQGNNMNLTGNGIQVPARNLNNLVIMDNSIQTSGGVGITATPNTLNGISIQGNNIQATGAGQAIVLTNSIASASIVGNYLLSNSTSGVCNLTGLSSTVVQGNQIISPTSAGLGGSSGALSLANMFVSCIVKDNYMTTVGGTPLLVGAITGGPNAISNNYIFTNGGLPMDSSGGTVNVNVENNHFETTGVGQWGARFIGWTSSAFTGNRVICTHAALHFQGTPSSVMRVNKNDFVPVFGVDGGNVVTATVSFYDNTFSMQLGASLFGSTGAALLWNNRRDAQSSDPSSSTAGSVGDIVPNSRPTAGGISAWVCVSAGSTGAAVFKGIPLNA
jgi:hypothetical protein